jgi:hypothetical protein
VKITIKTIPNDSQAYPTVGDWFYDKHGTLQIRASKMSDKRYEMILILHELTEAFAASQNKVPEPIVTEFDLKYEQEMKDGKIPSYIDEPGFHPDCPYQAEHLLATSVEMALASALGVKWALYEKELIELSRSYNGGIPKEVIRKDEPIDG